MTASTTSITASQPQPIVASPNGPHSPKALEAYQRLIDEIRSVPDGDVIGINIDVPTAVATVRGVLGKVGELRARLVNLADFDAARFDKLGDYALALEYAHTLYLAASTPPEVIEQLVIDGTALRKVLLANASTLAMHGLVNGQRLKEIRGSTGYLDLACDLSALAAILRDSWNAIAGKTAVTVAELDRAQTISEHLVDAVGERAQMPAGVTTAADNRQRAFSLLVNVYDDVRRAVSYLRWREGDADTIVPSLYARASRRKSGPPAVAASSISTPIAPAVAAPTPMAPGAQVGAPTPAPAAPQGAAGR
jgi:hypothetical protein